MRLMYELIHIMSYHMCSELFTKKVNKNDGIKNIKILNDMRLNHLHQQYVFLCI